MIFVTVGTNEARFDRLLGAVAGLTIDEELLIQHGHSSPMQAERAELVDFLPFDAMVETIRRARVVVTHAGVGTVMIALANGTRPIVIPRLKVFGEAVDDHQLQLGRRFAEAGLVTLIESLDALGNAVQNQSGEAPRLSPSNSLAADLRAFLDELITPSGMQAKAPARA